MGFVFRPEFCPATDVQLAPYVAELAAMLPRIEAGELTINGAADAIGLTRGTACVLYCKIRDQRGNPAAR